MIEEIGRRPTSIDMTCATQNPQGSAHHPENREGYAFSAAIGLGLITLGKGRNAGGLTDMRIEQRLRYMYLKVTASVVSATAVSRGLC